jgi:hypothetical protein
VEGYVSLSDPNSIQYAGKLANKLFRDIVDMERYGGDFVKMIAGGVRKDLDGPPRSQNPLEAID